MAIPLVARSGGLLIAVPEPYLDNDALLDAALDSHDGVLGPSQEFVSELCEEDDETNLVPLGRTCSVLVLDVSDAALAHFAEYDPVTHDFDSCLSFDNNRPAALPVITDIFEDIKAWIQATAEGSRVHFYSAREEIEEPAPPKAAASKRGPPRKITNQAIMEQLSSLSMQMGSQRIHLHHQPPQQRTPRRHPALVGGPSFPRNQGQPTRRQHEKS